MIKNFGIDKGKKRAYESLKAWPIAKLFMRKLLALALLPANCINNAFYNLVASAEHDIVTYFHNLLLYYERYWLRRVGPQKYSVYNRRERTNNHLESYHNVLGGLVIGYRRNIWIFIECVMDLLIKARNEVLLMERGQIVHRRQEASVTRRLDMVERSWVLFVHNGVPLQIDKFLSAASHIYNSFGRDLVCTEVNEINNFVNVNNYNDILQIFPDIHCYQMIDDFREIHVLHRTGCSFCRCKFLATRIVLPCYHWYSCQQCLTSRLRISRLLNRNLQCITCGIICQRVATIDVERQISK